MSSETITRNDLKAILEQCGMSGMAFQEAAVMNITYATITSTTNAIQNPDNSVILGNTNIFSIDSSTNRVIINKNCTCLVLTSVVFSAVTNANNVRLLTLGKNSSTTEIVQAAISHGVAWDSHMAAHYHNFSEGDEAHFIVRAEDGNSTLREGHTILIPIDNKIDTIAPVDYVVEKGTLTNGGKYCKWNSGKAEFWYHTYVSTGVTTAVWIAPIYYADYDTWSNVWANIFNTAPTNVVCTSNNSQFISVIPYTYDINGITNMRFISVGAKTSVAYAFSLYVIGTWK